MKLVVLFVAALSMLAGSSVNAKQHQHQRHQVESTAAYKPNMKELYMFLQNNHVSVPSNQTVCWRDTYGRGVGVPVYACPSDQEKAGGLCYPVCSSGYTGNGPVCWQNCEAGFTDEGALCSKPASITSANTSACPWYDACGVTVAVGCSVCPAVANTTVHNDGCTCRVDPIVYAKNSYGRGAGTPLDCGKQEEDAGLCYNYCNTNFTGVGPVCWEQCPSSHSDEEGAMCCASPADCDQKVDELAISVLSAVAQAIIAGEDPSEALAAVKAIIDAALGFVLPLCSDFP